MEVDELKINIDEMTDIINEEARLQIMKEIADENLAYVNRHSQPVRYKASFYTKYVKRLFDIVLSSVALVVSLPINLLLGICTYLDVGRPIFFCQKRIGKDGTTFEMIKFRNMKNTRNKHGELLPAKQRVTKFGRFVRKTSLDELLNFWSIFKGEMSIIGPRPLPLLYEPFFSDRHRQRNLVRPGLECPFLRPLDHKPTWTEQLENDIYYVENVSFALDMRLAWALVKAVIDRRSAAIRGSAFRGSFMGYNKDAASINSQRVPAHFVERVLGDELLVKEVS